jgi:hypothetical protein
MDGIIGEDLEAVLSQMFETAQRLSENQRRLNQAVELLEGYREEHPENEIKLLVDYDNHVNELRSLKFVTPDFSLAERANFKIDEQGYGSIAVGGHVTYTLDLTAGNIVDDDGNSYPIFCEDKTTFTTNVLREVGYTISGCDCGPKTHTYACPHEFSRGYSEGLGLELTIKRFKGLGLNEELMTEVEGHVQTVYEKSDEELYARIGELSNASIKRLNEMLMEGDTWVGEAPGPGN